MTPKTCSTIENVGKLDLIQVKNFHSDKGIVKRVKTFFAHAYTVVPTLLVEKIIFSPFNCLWTCAQNQLIIIGSISRTQFWPIDLLSTPSPIPHYLDFRSYCKSYSCISVISQFFFFFCRIDLDILISLPFHVSFRIGLSKSTKSSSRIFIGNILNF